MSFIEMTDVKKIYVQGEQETVALGGINLEIEEGELAIILGESGAGKTTILNILGGMDNPTSGLVRLGGVLVSSLSQRQLTKYRRSDIGFVFQFYNLIPSLTAEENVSLATQLNKNSLRPQEILEEIGLGHRCKNFPAQLSGGEQQRVAIARALAKKPKVLLCDEPTGALDYSTGKSVLKVLSEYGKKYGMTIVIITHNHALSAIGDRVITIKNGLVSSMITNENPCDIDKVEW